MKPQVILLAAGKSSRTWPITEKTLVTFFGKTVLEHQINTLISAGLTEICIVANPQNLPIVQTITAGISGAQFRFGVQHNPQDGQRGGILAAAQVIDDTRPTLICCSNDVVDNSLIINLVSTAEKSPAEVFLVGKIMDKYFPGGYLSLSSDKNFPHRLTGIIEKPEPGTEPSNLVNIFFHLYKSPRRLLELLNTIPEDDHYEEILQTMIDEGVVMEAVGYKGFWQAIKYPWHFLDLMEYFLDKITGQQIDPTAFITPTAVINGPVIIEAGAKVYDFAVINGPVYLGKGVIVANHALVRQSHIGARSVVGHGTDIARSLIQNDCWTHQNFVGDSVFDANVSLGAGTRTGNLRLDEGEISSVIKGVKVNTGRKKFGCVVGKNVRVGINVSTMPGVKIGGGVFVGAGGIYQQDIGEKLFTTPETKVLSRENTKFAPLRESF